VDTKRIIEKGYLLSTPKGKYNLLYMEQGDQLAMLSDKQGHLKEYRISIIKDRFDRLSGKYFIQYGEGRYYQLIKMNKGEVYGLKTKLVHHYTNLLNEELAAWAMKVSCPERNPLAWHELLCKGLDTKEEAEAIKVGVEMESIKRLPNLVLGKLIWMGFQLTQDPDLEGLPSHEKLLQIQKSIEPDDRQVKI
jgi:hypothetical protein